MSAKGVAWPSIDRQPCGTEAAYRRHRRRGEDACEACKWAAAQAMRWRRQRARGAGR